MDNVQKHNICREHQSIIPLHKLFLFQGIFKYHTNISPMFILEYILNFEYDSEFYF
jgi:hypothetical protein